jgi:hypothetical protein
VDVLALVLALVCPVAHVQTLLAAHCRAGSSATEATAR